MPFQNVKRRFSPPPRNLFNNTEMLGAVAGTPGTFPADWSSYQTLGENGVTSSVVGVNTEDGMKRLDWRVNGTPTLTSNTNLNFDIYPPIVEGLIGNPFVVSVFVKVVAGTLPANALGLNFFSDDAAGGYLGNDELLIQPNSTASLRNQRFKLAINLNKLNVNSTGCAFFLYYTLNVPIDVTLGIAMPQLERGSVATKPSKRPVRGPPLPNPPPPAAPPPPPPPPPAVALPLFPSNQNTWKFVKGNLGSQAHLSSPTSPYGSTANILTAMNYIGFVNIRDGSDSGNRAKLTTLAQGGLRICLTQQYGNGGFVASDYVSFAHTLISTVPGSICCFEGPNEIPNDAGISYNGQIGFAAGKLQCQDAWNLIKADSLFNGIPVYSLTLGDPSNTGNFQAIGNISAYANAMPLHFYPGPYGSVSDWWNTYIQNCFICVPGSPRVTTEIGVSTGRNVYPSPPGGNWSTTEDVQAKRALNIACYSILSNTCTFWYELAENNIAGTNYEGGLGLFHQDWTAKPAATALHNFTTILLNNADPIIGTHAFTYSVSAISSNGPSFNTIIRKNATTDIIAVWWEPGLWDNNNYVQIAPNPASQQITVSFGGVVHGTVNVYDPMIGTSPISTVNNVSSRVITLVDHPILIEVIN